jgi:hypothetical protein
MENNMSRQMACEAMINCLDAANCTSTTASCYLNCGNMNGLSGPTYTCVSMLVNAACM